MRVVAAGIITAFMALPAAAQDMDGWSIEAGVSTLGVYVAPTYELSENLSVRGALYAGSFSDTYTDGGNNFPVDLSLTSFALMADYAPFGGGFRVSGGLSVGGYEFDATATNPTIDGTTYNATFTGSLQQKDNVAPVIAVGYAGSFTDNWGFMAEIGARITDLELSTTGQNALAAADRAQFDQDIADINDDLSELGVIPFVTLGVTYSF